MESNILIIDDSASSRTEIINSLRTAAIGVCCREARDGAEGFKSLLNAPVDLIICDLEMPHLDGFKFISMAKARESLCSIPIILLTGKEDRSSKIRGLELGASDYITKPFDTGELVARVRIQLQIKHLQDELKRSNELLKELSYTDYQTGLFNKRYLMQTLDSEINRTRRNGGCFSLVFLDIDFFKKVNDTFGHQNGDRVLTVIAETLHAHLRSYSTVARYGGEEFAIVLPEIPLSGATVVAGRLREALQGLSLPAPMEGLKITGSFGVAAYPADQATDIDTLIRQADDALYRAKQQGRNRVEAAGE